MKRLLPLLALVAVLFTGCPDPREVANYDSDPRVLRGSWDFVVTDPVSNVLISTQKVEFTPTFVSEYSYSVKASVALEDEVYALSGWVNESNLRFVRPQRSFIPLVSLTLTGQATAKPRLIIIEGRVQYLSRWRYFGVIYAIENGVAKFSTLEIIRNR